MFNLFEKNSGAMFTPQQHKMFGTAQFIILI